jgi:hypothetical protein
VKKRVLCLSSAGLIGLALALLLAWLHTAPPARAAPDTQCAVPSEFMCYVDCAGCFHSVQEAVSAAGPGDEVRIAGASFGQRTACTISAP